MVTFLKKIILIQVYILFAIMSYSQTTINAGPVSGIWSSTFSPYTVMGDIYIANGNTLLIGDNVTVYFEDGVSLTVNTGATLNILASSGNEATLTANNTSVGWNGIDISNNSSSNTFQYCIIEYVIKSPASCSGNFASNGAVYLSSSNNTSFSNCTFQYNEVCSGGGIAFHSSDVDIENCYFTENEASNYGGGIYILDGGNNNNISYCEFDENNAGIGGGALWIDDTEDIIIANSDFTYNSCTSSSSNTYGGGIGIICSDFSSGLLITNCNISNNSTTSTSTYYGYGGGVFIHQQSTEILTSNIEESDIDYNSSSHYGGGIYIEDCQEETYINTNHIYYNSAVYGGGIYATNIVCNNNIMLHQNDIYYNFVSSFGAGIYLSSCEIEAINNNKFLHNTINNSEGELTGSGGGAYINNCTIQHLADNDFGWNEVGDNGGAIYLNESDCEIVLAEITTNFAGYGAGIYMNNPPSSGNVYLVNNLIADNTASENGGGIYSNSDFYLYNCTVANNDANATSGYGGGIYHTGITVNAVNTIIWGNTANTNNNVYPTTDGSDYEYSCCPSCTTGTGNINSDPSFVSTTDYRIQMEDSYCDNAGNNSATYLTTYDLLGTDRILYSTIDIGAYESIGQYVCGDVGDEDWEDHNSNGIDYVVICDIYVESGETLDIEEGTTVVFDGSYQLDVEGCLNAVGSLSEKITFSSTSGNTWEGIRFVDLNNASPAEATSYIQFCEIEYIYKAADGGCPCTFYDPGPPATSYSEPDFSGAIYIENSSGIEISNCLIHDNYVCAQGGGIYIGINSDPDIYDNEIYNNRANLSGGGICVMLYSDPDIYGNDIHHDTSTNKHGGGIRVGRFSSPLIYENIISNNYSGNTGAGIDICNFCNPTIYNCILSNNECLVNGGGIYINSNCDPTIYNCLIDNNSAEGNGGGIYMYASSPKIYNCTIADNEAEDDGDGVYFDASSSPDFQNDIIWDNGNANDDVSDAGSQPYDDDPEYRLCDIENFIASLNPTTNFSDDPEFRDGYHISYYNSRCKDGADYTISPQTTYDLDGNDRYQGDNTMDMGCYENPGDVHAWYIVLTDIEENEAEEFEISSYPNPVEEKVNIVIQSDITTNVKVFLFDNIGKTVFTAKWDVNEGENYYTLARNQLSAGVYFLKITDDQNFSKMHKLIFK
jgi:parallel beta-helix repeat protein/predicted outer membrane repeat protein